MRDGGGRGVVGSLRQHHVDVVRRQHFHGAGQCRTRKGMGVDAEEQRAVDFLVPAVQADRLGDGQDVPLIKSTVEGGTAVPRGAKRDPLLGHTRIGSIRKVGGD